jgi:hypothetical protein
MSENGQDWTAEEQAALKALRLEQALPQALEDTVVGVLVERGLLRRPPTQSTRWIRIAAALAVAAGLFGVGLFVGSRAGSSADRSHRPRYLLLLEGADSLTAEEEARRVAEYRAWARREAHAGHLLSGEKLEPAALALGAGPARTVGGEAVGGFFVIVAKDDAEAVAIAKGCPQLRHGGRIVVRKIAPT